MPVLPPEPAASASSPGAPPGLPPGPALRGLSLFGRNLDGADLAGFDLTCADLQGARLHGARLVETTAHGVCLRGAGLTGADASGLRARDADLERALATGAVFRNAVLRDAVLLEADLQGADLQGADLRGVDLRGADLRDADLRGADLTNADLSRATLTGARVAGAACARACVTDVVDADGAALAGLLDAGAYTGLPPALVQAGQVTGAVGRRGARLGRALAQRVRGASGPARAWLAARTAGLRQTVAERAADAEARQQEREARSKERQERWARLRARREADRAQQAEARRAQRASAASLRAARRLLRAGAPAPLVQAPARPDPLPAGGAQVVPRGETRRAAERARLQEALVAVRSRATAEQAAREAARRSAARAAAEAAENARRAALDAASRAEQEAREAERAAQEQAVAAAQAAARAEAQRIATAEAAARRARELAAREAAREAARLDRQRRRAQTVARVPEAPGLQRAAALRARREAEAAALRQQAAGSRGAPSERRAAPRPARPVAQTRDGVPQGRGVDLRGVELQQRRLGAVDWYEADLTGARLSGARLHGADLSGATLDGAVLEGARLKKARLREVEGAEVDLGGARLRNADLARARLPGATLVDADLRNADLSGVDLSGADLTGADLRGATLRGANLQHATLSAARLPDLDLREVRLDHASLDQADLAGTRWEGASVFQADLSGALGLSGRDRRALSERGARTGEQGLQDLFGGLRSTQVRAALVILGLGVGTWLGARFLASTTGDPTQLAEEAAAMRSEDPAAASVAFEELADLSTRVDEQVGYLVEAANLADLAGQPDRAGELLASALDRAGSSPGISADVRVRKATRHLERGEWGLARQTALPLLGAEGHPAETRARAVLVWQEATAALEEQDPAALAADTDDPVAGLVSTLSDLPEAVADLYLALAELRSNRGEVELALAAIDQAWGLDLPPDQHRRLQETRARVLDRAGELDAAAAVYEELAQAADLSAPRAAMATLALADIRQRQGQPEAALALVAPLAEAATDPGVRGRALLLQGRLAEQADDPAAATSAYQQVLSLDGLDPDTKDDARISLARVLLEDASGASAEAAVAGLPPEAAATVLAHARLGEARGALDAGLGEVALGVYEEVLATDALPDDLARTARAGKAEALAALGELAEATALWRALLADDPDASERAELELQLAQGLLQGNEIEEAAAAFASLAGSAEPDVRFRGLLGQADVARVSGEAARARDLYQRVADRAPDPAYQVQALQELADLATEQDRPEEALRAWRALLGVVPPGHAAAAPARLAVMLGLADLGRVEEALVVCQQAVATTSGVARMRARGGCAELQERARSLEAAHETWAALTTEDLPADLAADAWLGAARTALALERPDAAARLAAGGLAVIEATPHRLPLLGLRVDALRAVGDPEALAAAESERDALVAAAPALAAPLLVQAAADARSDGRPDEAAALLERAVALPLSEPERAGALVELGDTLLEAGDVAAAGGRFEEARAIEGGGDEAAFAAAMGLAEVRRRAGALDDAIDLLDEVEPPDTGSRRWWLEARARLHSEAGAGAAAVAVWTELVEVAGDAAAPRTAALRGAADAWLAQDRPEEALPLYEEAARIAPEPAAAGWAQLGAAQARAHQGDPDGALAALARLQGHPDPEVALQAALLAARLHADAERWEAVLTSLEGAEAASLGPGWDASVIEAQASALAALERPEAAAEAWRELADRWPDSDEALLPAWLGLADVARMTGDLEAARDWATRALEAARDPGYRDRAEDLVASLDGG